jgi:hypothetical protein
MCGFAHWKALVLAGCLVATALTCGGVVLIGRAMSHDCRTFERVRADIIGATAIEFTGQQQYTELNDPTSVDYFMAALRAARRYNYEEGFGGGISYTVHVRLADGDSFTICVAIPNHDRGMTLYTPLEGLGISDPDYYLIRFPSPLPASLAAVLKKLR